MKGLDLYFGIFQTYRTVKIISNTTESIYLYLDSPMLPFWHVCFLFLFSLFLLPSFPLSFPSLEKYIEISQNWLTNEHFEWYLIWELLIFKRNIKKMLLGLSGTSPTWMLPFWILIVTVWAWNRMVNNASDCQNADKLVSTVNIFQVPLILEWEKKSRNRWEAFCGNSEMPLHYGYNEFWENTGQAKTRLHTHKNHVLFMH